MLGSKMWILKTDSTVAVLKNSCDGVYERDMQSAPVGCIFF